MDSSVKFTTLELQSSITYNSANNNAVDISAPLPFLTWVQYFADVSSDPEYLLRQYKQYVTAWFAVKNVTVTSSQDVIKGLYESLFRTIAINYLTAEEKRFVQNFNLNNPTEIAAVLPLLVRKIKDICLHYANLRDQAKSAVYGYNIKGSEFSVERVIHNEILQSFLDPEINKLFAQAGIDQNSLRDVLKVSFDEYYDTETNYFDVNTQLPASAYDATEDRATYFAANSYPFDPNLFIDFDNSVVAAIQQYPVILQETGTNFAVDFNFSSTDLQFLKDQDFTNLVNNLDSSNLKLNNLRDTLQQFSGTTFYYLSTNSTSQFTYGKLFEADAFANYLNRRLPTTAITPSEKLVAESKIGRFFRPDKQGILNFLSFNTNGTITALSADHIYVFPDPSAYGNISGLTRTKFETPFSFQENTDGLKCLQTNTARFGEAISDFLTKFRGYQSRSESLNWDATGPSRIQDPVEFFTALDKTKWANDDVFPVLPDNSYPIDSRQTTLLNSNKTLFQHRADIYNNEYSLYKELYAANNPQQDRLTETGPDLTCLTLDGHTFYDSVSGYNFDYTVEDPTQNYSGVVLNTNNSLSATDYTYILQSVKLYPELKFYATSLDYTIDYYDGRNFIEPSVVQPTLYDFGSFIPDPFTSVTLPGSAHIYIESGPFVSDGDDVTPVSFNLRFNVQNTLVGDTLSSANTQLYSQTGTLSVDLPLYEHHNTFGDFYFRNANSTQIVPASAALSGIFAKFSPDIINELNNKVRNIDIVLDTLIVETENYLVFNKIQYNQSTNVFEDYTKKQMFIKRGDETKFSTFSNIWFDSSKDLIYVTRTNIWYSNSATNDKSLYYDLFVYDFSDVRQINSTFNDTVVDLINTPLSSTYVVQTERPVLSYTPDSDKFSVKYLVKDASNAFYHVDSTFRLDNFNSLYSFAQCVLYPGMYLHSDNFNTGSFTPEVELKYVSFSQTPYALSGNMFVINAP